ncbi:MAG: WecB/TagA/CpsF family glycosyltransferase [Deltaproteobacteria bacterium]|nr:WecB/TagA/CpsF family glycosyltransferase [Candidatus Zymogenaceae bacterium]
MFPINNTVTLEGIEIARLTLDGLLDAAVVAASGKPPGGAVFMYANIHTMNLARKDRTYHEMLTRADLVYCDGVGVVLGARVAGLSIPGRLTAADFISDLASRFTKEDRSIFVLGGEPGVAEQAVGVLGSMFPGLRVTGTHHGYFDRKGMENEAVLEMLARNRPDCLFVGMGSPAQEEWALFHRDRLGIPLIWCVGATFDFVAGKVSRAPSWMRKVHLEWFHRFLMEPKRMFYRYAVGNPSFLFRMLGLRLKRMRGDVS